MRITIRLHVTDVFSNAILNLYDMPYQIRKAKNNNDWYYLERLADGYEYVLLHTDIIEFVRYDNDTEWYYMGYTQTHNNLALEVCYV